MPPLLELAGGNPFRDGADFSVRHMILRWHRRAAPSATAARLDAHRQQSDGVRGPLRGILLVHVKQRRANDLVADAVASEAGVPDRAWENLLYRNALRIYKGQK